MISSGEALMALAFVPRACLYGPASGTRLILTLCVALPWKEISKLGHSVSKSAGPDGPSLRSSRMRSCSGTKLENVRSQSCLVTLI